MRHERHGRVSFSDIAAYVPGDPDTTSDQLAEFMDETLCDDFGVMEALFGL